MSIRENITKYKEAPMSHRIYVTVQDKGEARRMGAKLLEDRLIACANILDGLESIYRWQGEVCNSKEALLLAKTTEDKIPAVVDAIKAMHSYELPCIVAFPITTGLPAFLKWVAEEVK